MNSVSRALSAEEIEAHHKWVRSLARSLLTEREEEDRTQDVWGATLETGGGKSVPQETRAEVQNPRAIRKPRKTEP